jgi:hypothetical protein
MLIGTRSSFRFGCALGALVALAGLASAQIGVKPPVVAPPVKPPAPAVSLLLSPTPTPTPTFTPTPTATATQGPFAPVRIATGALRFDAIPGGELTPTPTYVPVRIATGTLRFEAVAGTEVTPTPTFVPVRIGTGTLRFEFRP